MQRDGRTRAVIEGLTPQVDGGRFPVKRVVNEAVQVEADVFTDGHDALACRLRYRHEDESQWHEVAMSPLVNDRWRASFTVDRLGRWFYAVGAWVDHFLSWHHDLSRRVDAADIEIALQVGEELIDAAIARAAGGDADALLEFRTRIAGEAPLEERRRWALDPELERLMMRYPDRTMECHHEPLCVIVDRERARYSTWYELFPRSCTDTENAHGSFKQCQARLGDIAAMGFDILYLPPIHPIGRVKRKGPNNTLQATADDPGSPWAIGAREGGHKSVHPDLGSLDEFRDFVAAANAAGLELALDIAFQCAPDHPYVEQHPTWFRWRPDGTVQYAENPPKKYQDIYPFNFESEDWQALWQELESVFQFWIDQGVRVFRVDNPHTKPFPFWEWCIGELKRKHPDLIFLSEAFARPKIMNRLAKVGFTQSYTYFTWRNTKQELTAYMQQLNQPPVRDFFRPNFWPNTPDILPEYLQFGGRPAFMIRVVLAATLSASYGIYGPAYELLEREPREPGSEEYLNSEKYQVRAWDLERPESLHDFLTRINRIRRENPALQQNWSLDFHTVDNDELLCYSKHSEADGNTVVVVVNLDAYHRQSGWVELPLEALGLDANHPYQMHDLITGARFLWHGARNYVELDPHRVPAHIFRLLRHVRTERDFEYFF